MRSMRYPYLLFDADNTLYDFDKTQNLALEKAMLELHGSFEASHLSLYDEVNSAFWHAFERGEIKQQEIKEKRFRVFFERLGLDLSVDEMNAAYLKYLSEGHYLLEGAEVLIKHLAQRHTLLIVTNGLKEVQRPRFNASSIGQYFKGIVVSDEIGVSKPNKEIFDVAFEKLGQPDKSEVLMIGDSLGSDILGGMNYGLDTCWFNPHEKANKQLLAMTYQIKNLNELIPLVEAA